MEIIVEKTVPVDVYVDKVIKRSILKPYRKEVQVKEVIVERSVPQDIVVVKKVPRVSKRYRDVPQVVYEDHQIVKEVEVMVAKDVHVTKRIEVPYEKIIDVPEIQVVKKPVYVQKIVEKIIETVEYVDVPIVNTQIQQVEKIVYVDKVIPRPSVRYVDKEVYVEKTVSVPRDVHVENVLVQDRFEDVEVEQIR